MNAGLLRYLPNCLTLSRVVLAIPLGILILREDYTWALSIGLVAGLTDALDGFLARRLNALSRLGAALDPIADKTLIMTTFLSLAQSGLIPWYLAIAVIVRDVVIVIGAACYHRFIGRFEFSASALSKCNMLIQICFCVLVLASQILPEIPPVATLVGSIAVLFLAAASGADYVISWAAKAIQSRRAED